MLVLSRKLGEVIQVGNFIEITVVRISATEVRIGIDAPKHVPILRPDAKSFGATAGSGNGDTEACMATRGNEFGSPTVAALDEGGDSGRDAGTP